MKDIVKDILLSVVSACIGSGSLSADSIMIKDTTVEFIKTMWGYFAVAGIAMSIIYFLLEINRKLAFERTDFSMHSFGAPFLKLGASIIVVGNGKSIISWLVKAGNQFITWADTTFDPAWTAQEGLKDVVDQMTDGMGFFLAIALILPAFCMYLVTVVCSIVWKYKALTYKIEVLYRMGISPIALADVYSGQNAQGVRWLKAMLGLGLYAASFIIVVKLGNAIALQEFADSILKYFGELKSGAAMDESAKTVWGMIGNLAGMLVIPIAELGVISAIRSAIKEALA